MVKPYLVVVQDMTNAARSPMAKNSAELQLGKTIERDAAVLLPKTSCLTYLSRMAQDNASQHQVRTGNGSPLFYQSEDASIVLGRRKTKPQAIAVDRNSASLPIPILRERRICWTSEYLGLTRF
jgi:hypothetical protein